MDDTGKRLKIEIYHDTLELIEEDNTSTFLYTGWFKQKNMIDLINLGITLGRQGYEKIEKT